MPDRLQISFVFTLAQAPTDCWSIRRVPNLQKNDNARQLVGSSKVQRWSSGERRYPKQMACGQRRLPVVASIQTVFFWRLVIDAWIFAPAPSWYAIWPSRWFVATCFFGRLIGGADSLRHCRVTLRVRIGKTLRPCSILSSEISRQLKRHVQGAACSTSAKYSPDLFQNDDASSTGSIEICLHPKSSCRRAGPNRVPGVRRRTQSAPNISHSKSPRSIASYINLRSLKLVAWIWLASSASIFNALFSKWYLTNTPSPAVIHFGRVFYPGTLHKAVTGEIPHGEKQKRNHMCVASGRVADKVEKKCGAGGVVTGSGLKAWTKSGGKFNGVADKKTLKLMTKSVAVFGVNLTAKPRGSRRVFNECRREPTEEKQAKRRLACLFPGNSLARWACRRARLDWP